MRQEQNNDNMLADIRRRLNVIAYGSGAQADGSIVGRLPLLLTGLKWRTWVFAAISAALIAGAAARFNDVAEVIVVSLYIAVFVTCAATDLASFRVPNVITYPATVLALLAAAFMPEGDLRAALIGGATAAGFMLVALIISRGAMGLGDVKLAIVSGLAVGWPLVGNVLLLMALSGGAVAVVLLAVRVKGRRDPIPYAPFISAATIAVILWQGTAFARF
ncbi:MAG TPA: A24 family peptidase [Dehalococcoidia bacterium]|nr:A24 family peptidase [Dehalococcoidia bacterium]